MNSINGEQQQKHNNIHFGELFRKYEETLLYPRYLPEKSVSTPSHSSLSESEIR